jgi:hypothetical protein
LGQVLLWDAERTEWLPKRRCHKLHILRFACINVLLQMILCLDQEFYALPNGANRFLVSID